MYKCRAPRNKLEFEAYYQLRWQVLREPWQQPIGSEQDELEAQSYHRLVIDEQDNILGVARLHKSTQVLAHIRYMAIAEQAKNKGIGRLLVSELEQLAIEVGANKIQLNAREEAIGFYEKQGYIAKGFSHLLYGSIKHEKMSKLLETLSSHDSDNAQSLEKVWHQTIPLSKAMNISICHFDRQRLITNCEPTFNKNLHNTMFAGSIYTLATLTGWGWVYFLLNKQPYQADIVLAEGNIKYLAPLAGVAHARTSVEQVSGTCAAFEIGKNSRFVIDVEVCCGDNVVAVFKGHYVAVLKRD